jgi:hypothetical protein
MSMEGRSAPAAAAAVAAVVVKLLLSLQDQWGAGSMALMLWINLLI